MNCHEAQAVASLYLYGELDFAQEEAYEAHLIDCSFCQLTLNDEKNWHAALNVQQRDVPLHLLSSCRQDLSARCGSRKAPASFLSFVHRVMQILDVRTTAWSFRFAAASALVMLGYGAAQIGNHFQFSGRDSASMAEISFANAPVTHVQNVQGVGGNRVRILVEQVRNGEVSGSPADDRVRELLLAGARESMDPGLRVDAVEMLAGQRSPDVRDALIKRVENDPNAAVRMKALEGLRQFAGDADTREALKFVLSRDSDPGVRTQAIDVLVPAGQRVAITPQLLMTLEDVIRSGQTDDYVQARCHQILQGLDVRGDSY